ncbi:MAG: hypothetical protein JW874_05655, partial [Spirochaetales bacterium]|nr:hypothetical protein [Spirochaetales bacterium]
FLLILSVFALISCEYLGFVDEGERHPYDPSGDGGGDSGYKPEWDIYSVIQGKSTSNYSQICMEFYNSEPMISFVTDNTLSVVRIIDPGQNMPMTGLSNNNLRYSSLAFSQYESAMYLVSANDYGYPQYTIYDGSYWNGWTQIDDTNSNPWPTVGITSLAMNEYSATPVTLYFQNDTNLYVNGNYTTPFDLTSTLAGIESMATADLFPQILSIDSAYDQNYRPHAAYLFETNSSGYMAYYARHVWQNSDLSWGMENIPLPGLAENLNDCEISISVQANDVHIILSVRNTSANDIRILYQYKHDGQWLDTNSFPAVMSIDVPNTQEFMPDLAVDQNGMVHAVFWRQDSDSSNGYICYARIEEDAWHYWDVEHTSYWDQIPRPRIRIRDNDQSIHLAYFGTGPSGNDTRALKYARLVN